MPAAEFKKLNRFTTIPFAADLLLRKKLVLINPVFWEDFNDLATVEIFREVSKKQSIYALCLTDQNETIHHWNAFATGSEGCNIEFSPRKLFAILDQIDGLSHGKVQYTRIQDLKRSKFETAQLPYLKRDPYKNENEYRLIYTNDLEQQKLFEIDIDLSIIRRITITNKIPKDVFETTKAQLLALHPGLKIYQSTIYNNSVWINHFRKILTSG